jgi:acetylornithine/LysW-gamma-L-lysine aminotransferase
MFACGHYGLAPDLLCLAKGIAGGVPMGAVLIGPRVKNLPKQAHGSTFGGNPLSCAAARATLRYIQEERLPERASLLGKRLQDGLAAIQSPLIRQVRGLGLMVGMELKVKASPYLARLSKRGVLALSAGATVIRFLPPLVISPKDIDTVVEQVAQVLEENDG